MRIAVRAIRGGRDGIGFSMYRCGMGMFMPDPCSCQGPSKCPCKIRAVKMVANKIPYICISTTYSGSEISLLRNSRRRRNRRCHSDSGSGNSMGGSGKQSRTIGWWNAKHNHGIDLPHSGRCGRATTRFLTVTQYWHSPAN